jgi:hypothetical protein
LAHVIAVAIEQAPLPSPSKLHTNR